MNSRGRVLVMGAVVGAILGLITGYIVADRLEDLERRGRSPRVQANLMEWLKLGMAFLGLARRLAGMITG